MGEKIVYCWRYYISHGVLKPFEPEKCRETPKCYDSEHSRFLKREEGIAVIKDRTSYPYIDIWFTEEKTREFVVNKILDFFKDSWGLS